MAMELRYYGKAAKVENEQMSKTDVDRESTVYR